MDRRHKFITKSSYFGSWNEETNCMNGYGRYIYPDGSEYRGHFKNGKFHGYGRLRLSPPYKFIFKGLFVNGKLEKIDDMSFTDGLHVKGNIEDNHLKMDKWRYCDPIDRRFSTEIASGLPPVGPLSYLTREQPTRTIDYPGAYDVGQGIYKPHSGFIVKRLPPLPWFAFVGCEKTQQWIKENCRKNPVIGESLDPSTIEAGRILENNVQAEISLEEEFCIPKPRYISNYCKQSDSPEDDVSSNYSSLSEKSKASFSLEQIYDDIEQMFWVPTIKPKPPGKDLNKTGNDVMEPKRNSLLFSVTDI